MDQHAFEDFKRIQRRRHQSAWAVAFVASAAGFFLVGILWTYLAGIAEVILASLLAYELIRRWNRRCWLAQFPELRDQRFSWRPHHPANDGRPN